MRARGREGRTKSRGGGGGGGISRLESGVHPRLAISILYFEAGSFLRDGAVARRKRGLSEANPLSFSLRATEYR